MQQLSLRGLICLLLLGCHARPDPSLEQGAEYVRSAAHRRRALEASIVNPDNGYSAQRLARYREGAWGALPEWRPRLRPVTRDDIGRGAPTPDASWRRLPEAPEAWDRPHLEALGRDAFLHYPAQLHAGLTLALDDPEGPRRYGLWEHGGRVGGLVWVEVPGGVELALTCASCHAHVDAAGRLVLGLSNPHIDIGRAYDDFYRTRTERRRWGPGRVDVASDRLDNAALIADLRPVRYQRRLHRAATLRNGLLALSARIETGIITVFGGVVRPPRAMAFAMAWFLWGLADDLPPIPEGPGRAIFERECGRCHGGEGLSGPPVDLAVIGTPPAVGLTPSRTTGAYQTTSLRGLGQRRRFFADGSLRELEGVFDPRRGGGHAYGLGLDASERAALLGFLRKL